MSQVSQLLSEPQILLGKANLWKSQSKVFTFVFSILQYNSEFCPSTHLLCFSLHQKAVPEIPNWIFFLCKTKLNHKMQEPSLICSGHEWIFSPADWMRMRVKRICTMHAESQPCHGLHQERCDQQAEMGFSPSTPFFWVWAQYLPRVLCQTLGSST